MQQGQQLNKNLKKLAYLGCILCFLPASMFAIEVAGFQLSPYRVIVFALAFLYAPLSSWQLRIAKGENKYSVLFMVLWLVYALASYFWAKSTRDYIRSAYFLFAGVVLTLSFVRLMRDKDDILKAFRIIRWALLVVLLLGWYEAFTGDYHFLAAEKIQVYGRKNSLGFCLPVVMSSNVNDYATLMLFAMCTFFICWRTEENPTLKVIDLGGIVLSAAIIFVSTSRGNIFGLFLTVIFLMMKSKESRRMFAVVMVLAVIYLGTDIIMEIMEGQSFDLTEMLSGDAEGSDGIRANLIRNGFHFLGKTFGMGVGIGQIETWMLNEAIYDTDGILNIHNWWVELLTSYGIIFFIAYVAFFVKIFRNQNKRIASKDPVESEISTGLAAFWQAT